MPNRGVPPSRLSLRGTLCGHESADVPRQPRHARARGLPRPRPGPQHSRPLRTPRSGELVRGDAFDGKPTASGEPFDSNQFTTAHYDLPFDSRVRVRNLNNDREVELRVNDRVPLEALNNGRILDVSYAAARQLEMVEDGVVPIEITVLAWGPSR